MRSILTLCSGLICMLYTIYAGMAVAHERPRHSQGISALKKMGPTSADTLKKMKLDSLLGPFQGLWGYTFGDYYYKSNADPFQRGITNQYTGLKSGDNRFQFRRIYLGYDYSFNSKFSVELLLAAEDNGGEQANADTTASAPSKDVLPNFKTSFFIKLLNLTVHDLWKGTDLVIGQQYTPAFPLLIEKVYGYREIEKTIADRRGTPSFDLGVGLRGVFEPVKKSIGYNVLIANGRGNAPVQNNQKWLYGDIWFKFLNERLTLDLYADLKTINAASGGQPLRRRHMLKGFISYTFRGITVGTETFVNDISNGAKFTGPGSTSGNVNLRSVGYSLFFNGTVIKNKLDYFLRYDSFNPDVLFDNTLNYSSPAVAEYDPNFRETFFTCGLSYSPLKNIRFMPNLWLNSYHDQHSGLTNTSSAGYDLVYRMSFFYQFGNKKG